MKPNQKRFCDKGCGRGCTLSEYRRARWRALAIKKSLGRGWKVRVWDNLGWHHEVISPCQYIRVWQREALCGPRTYSAYISDTKGEPYVCWDGRGSSPWQAVEVAKKELHKDIKVLVRQANDLTRIARKDGKRRTP